MAILDDELQAKVSQREAESKLPLSPTEASAILEYLRLRHSKHPIDLAMLCKRFSIPWHRAQQVFKICKDSPDVEIRFIKGANMVRWKLAESKT
jgi:hypothetical protein